MNVHSISISHLREQCEASLTKRGASPDEARIVFDDYLDAELRGRASHGFMSWAVAIGAFPHSGTETVRQQGSIIEIDGNGATGHVVARHGIDLGLNDLDSRGVSAIGIRNVTRFNCPGPIARYAAERGAVAIVLEYGGANFMAPPGGKRAALSTNPIGIAVPGTTPLFVLDIATSERAIGYVNLAKLDGSPIPSSWGIDKEGRPTSDPAALAAVSSFGGYKGFGLALAFEILSGALVGVPIGSHGTLGRRGALIVLLAPTAFGETSEAFTASVQAFLSEITNVEPLDVTQPVQYPGLRGEDRCRAALARGIVELPAVVWEQLEKLITAAN
jgi:LDH2 family malate/lactate/ureidoglycolate dehydrogenase